MAERRLTARQARFVEEYLLDPTNATEAAIRAGYSEKYAGQQAHKLVENGRIQTAIKKAQAARARRVEITADDVLEGLRREAAGEGPDTSSTARIRAHELIGKHLGLFVERKEVTGKDGGPVRVERTDKLKGLSDDDLARLEERLARDAG